MRRIKIYQQNSDLIELIDDNNDDLDIYCKELSKMFQMNNIAILKTSNAIFIGRPSKLNGVTVEEDNNIPFVSTDNENKIKIEETEVSEETKPKEENDIPKEDIITDID